MSFAVAARPSKTSAYTYLEQPLNSPADETARFTHTAAQAPLDGWGEIIDLLIDISRLQDDYDGAGAVAPERGVVTGASKLALTLKAQKYPPPGRVTPSVNGTICFEWHTADGYQEIEVTSPVDAEACWAATGAVTAEVTPIAIA